jgi:hypothetical protein
MQEEPLWSEWIDNSENDIYDEVSYKFQYTWNTIELEFKDKDGNIAKGSAWPDEEVVSEEDGEIIDTYKSWYIEDYNGSSYDTNLIAEWRYNERDL